ncbi:excalibur calcium-binding domain-containing protein [Corynebacterium sp. zg-331]|nr:excalibur calcium-binding domain-containing protein [Corynebacterium sp. zg-331]MPV52884.1 hypothetical protein [Corynebacterium sp. zg331]
MYCEKRDQAARETAAQHATNYGLLSETDRALLGEPPAAETIGRRWPTVAIASVVALFTGAAITPGTETETEEAGFTPRLVTETSVEVQTSVVKITSEEVVTVTETATEEPQEANQEEERAEPAEQDAPDAASEDQAAQEPEPVAYNPAPEPAPAPASVYYASCRQAKAAGAAPLYAGSPGYRPGLDRDGDGIACEH